MSSWGRRWCKTIKRTRPSHVAVRAVEGRGAVRVPGKNKLSCEEHETVVADRNQMHAAVVAMGFTPRVRIVKVRRRGQWGEVSTCLDDVAGPGMFL